MAVSRHNFARILVIAFTTDNSDNDIESIDSVKFYRNEVQRVQSKGYTVNNVKAYETTGATGGALGTSLGAANIDIYLPETLPPPSIIRLEQSTQG